MSADVRARLAEALRPMIGRVHEPLRSDITEQWADALMPAVDELRREARTDELGRAVVWARGKGAVTIDQMHRYALDRQAALLSDEEEER